MGHAKAMHHLPLAEVVAGEDDDRGGRVDHMPVRAAAKRQIVPISETRQVGKRIMLAVVECASHLTDVDLGVIKEHDVPAGITYLYRLCVTPICPPPCP